MKFTIVDNVNYFFNLIICPNARTENRKALWGNEHFETAEPSRSAARSPRRSRPSSIW